MMATIRTHLYGEATIYPDSVTLEASAYELTDWARRPGASWPCSALARLDSIRATFDSNGLVDVDHPGADDVPGDEFSAWSSDVLRDVLPLDHPAWFVTVGQFRLEYLRAELRAERISYGELAELQEMARHIAPDDLELREAAGLPEHDEPGGISPEGIALGHRYEMGNVNAYCRKCSKEQGVTVLDCDYDMDK